MPSNRYIGNRNELRGVYGFQRCGKKGNWASDGDPGLGLKGGGGLCRGSGAKVPAGILAPRLSCGQEALRSGRVVA